MPLALPVCALPAAALAALKPSGVLPEVDIAVVEGYEPRVPPVMCDHSPKAGVVAFRAFVVERLGGGDSGICRDCGGAPASSEHHEGRAWDWTVNVNSPADVERVHKLIDWLLKPGLGGEPHANFRRIGLRYLIWDGKIWSATTRAWGPYTPKGSVNDTTLHRDHVHFSFGWPGALARTSFFQWLGVPPDPRPIPGGGTEPPPVPVEPGGERWPALAATGIGLVAGYWVARSLRWG